MLAALLQGTIEFLRVLWVYLVLLFSFSGAVPSPINVNMQVDILEYAEDNCWPADYEILRDYALKKEAEQKLNKVKKEVENSLIKSSVKEDTEEGIKKKSESLSDIPTVKYKDIKKKPSNVESSDFNEDYYNAYKLKNGENEFYMIRDSQTLGDLRDVLTVLNYDKFWNGQLVHPTYTMDNPLNYQIDETGSNYIYLYKEGIPYYKVVFSDAPESMPSDTIKEIIQLPGEAPGKEKEPSLSEPLPDDIEEAPALSENPSDDTSNIDNDTENNSDNSEDDIEKDTIEGGTEENTEEEEKEEEELHNYIYTAIEDKPGCHRVTCEDEGCKYEEIEDCEYNENNICVYCGELDPNSGVINDKTPIDYIEPLTPEADGALDYLHFDRPEPTFIDKIASFFNKDDIDGGLKRKPTMKERFTSIFGDAKSKEDELPVGENGEGSSLKRGNDDSIGGGLGIRPPVAKAIKTTLVSGAVGVGLVTTGTFQYFYLLILTLFFRNKKRVWRGLLTERKVGFIKREIRSEVISLQDIANKSRTFSEYMENLELTANKTYLPWTTKMTIVYYIGDERVETTVKADENKLLDILSEVDGPVTCTFFNHAARFNFTISFNFFEEMPINNITEE